MIVGVEQACDRILDEASHESRLIARVRLVTRAVGSTLPKARQSEITSRAAGTRLHMQNGEWTAGAIEG
jgi:transposase